MYDTKDATHTPKVFYADYPYSLRLKVIFAMSMLLYLLPVIAVALFEKYGVVITPAVVACAVVWLVTGLVSMLYLADKYHILIGAAYHVFVRDEAGALWRVHTAIWDPARFRATTIDRMIAPGAISDRADSGWIGYRPYLLSLQAKFCPPDARGLVKWESVGSIAALTDVKVYKETAVCWKVTFQAEGKRAKLVIPKAYPNLVPSYPYTDSEGLAPFALPLDLMLTPPVIGGIHLVAMLVAGGLLNF